MLRCKGAKRLLLYKNGVYEKVGGARGEGGWRADHEFSQNHPDTGTSTQGRSIGDVRDQSAPTADWVSL